jgi:hypothetical protein
MSDAALSAARRQLLGKLRALEASDRALTRALDGECAAEMLTYIDDVRRAREYCEALERVLLAELDARGPSRS